MTPTEKAKYLDEKLTDICNKVIKEYKSSRRVRCATFLLLSELNALVANQDIANFKIYEKVDKKDKKLNVIIFPTVMAWLAPRVAGSIDLKKKHYYFETLEGAWA